MAIGYRELIVLMSLFAVGVVLGAVWLFRRLSRRSSQAGQRPASDRLAELEALRRAGEISTEEYERQRASIIALV